MTIHSFDPAPQRPRPARPKVAPSVTAQTRSITGRDEYIVAEALFRLHCH